MLHSLKVSESGLLAQQRKLETIANNLANASTPGFRRILSTFVAEGRPAALGPDGVPLTTEVRPASITTAVDLKPGSIDATGNALDLAIEGEGFFVVQTPGGERYTRNGSFTMDGQGRLVTREGWPVLSTSGPIELPPAQPFEISSDGGIRSQGAEIARLKIVRAGRAQDWTPAEGTTLERMPGTPPPEDMPAEEVRVLSGYLESSNVSAVSELVQMIQAQRIFEAGQRLLVTADDTLRKAVNELPKVKG